MATIGNNDLTLSEHAKRMDPDGKIATIADILSQHNAVMDDAKWIEGNLPTGHRTTLLAGYPTATWRKLNYGVPNSKSVTVQITDNCGMLEVYSECDKALADLNGNTAEFRMSEDKPFLAAMSNTVASAIFYGDSQTDPEKIMGLAPRFNSLSAANGGQILDGGGTGSDNTSIWLVTWDESTAHMIYPKGSKVGLQHSDKGQVTLQDANGNNYEGYRTHYKWDLGMVVRDWRYIYRLANIDVSDLTTFNAATDNSAPLMRMMIEALDGLPVQTMGQKVFYCNKTVKTWLDIMAMEKTNVNLTIENFAGQPVTMFWGVPVKRCDAILNTEAQIT